jgi:hypothetical protein
VQPEDIYHKYIEFIKYETFKKIVYFSYLSQILVVIIETYIRTGCCDFNGLNDDKLVWPDGGLLLSERRSKFVIF